MGTNSTKTLKCVSQYQSITDALKNKVVTDPDSPNKQQVNLSSLWTQHKGPTLIQFFRRWG